MTTALIIIGFAACFGFIGLCLCAAAAAGDRYDGSDKPFNAGYGIKKPTKE